MCPWWADDSTDHLRRAHAAHRRVVRPLERRSVSTTLVQWSALLSILISHVDHRLITIAYAHYSYVTFGIDGLDDRSYIDRLLTELLQDSLYSVSAPSPLFLGISCGRFWLPDNDFCARHVHFSTRVSEYSHCGHTDDAGTWVVSVAGIWHVKPPSPIDSIWAMTVVWR